MSSVMESEGTLRPLLVNAVNVNMLKTSLLQHLSPGPGWDISSSSLRCLVCSHLRLWIMQHLRCVHGFESLFANSIPESFVVHMVHLAVPFKKQSVKAFWLPCWTLWHPLWPLSIFNPSLAGGEELKPRGVQPWASDVSFAVAGSTHWALMAAVLGWAFDVGFLSTDRVWSLPSDDEVYSSS